MRIKFLFYSLLLLLSGCKSIQYIPVESERFVSMDSEKRDSIYIYDSIFIREKTGRYIDTIEITRWRTEYRDRIKIDSIFIKDSIQVPFPIEKKLTRWQNIKLDIGGIAIGSVITVVTIVIIWLLSLFRLKKR